MPFEQNGKDATLDIRGDSNDIGRDQINLVVHNSPLPISLIVSPTDKSFTCERGHRKEDLENTLQGKIQFIQEISRLVSLDSAKEILARITAILSLVPEGIRNNNSLDTLVRSCESICSTLAVATKGISVGKIGEALANALYDLKRSVDNFHSKEEEALEHRINKWATDLDGISTTFSGRLNMVSGIIPLGQVYEFLARSDDFPGRLMPEPLPSAPVMFFGREELMDRIKRALLCEKNVALIGTGGIGKSSLAKMVIHDNDIKKRYMRRFFVRYDDANSTTMTFDIFTQCIARTLGLSGTENGCQVRSNLTSSSVLLVLDNAETFEEAIDPWEKTRISSFISDIALTSGVTVILTSRTRNNARDIPWARFDVLPLDEVSARRYFREIYKGEMQVANIDALLRALDFHPLSIHILAYTAEENQWTERRLLDEWQVQQSRLLQTGHGKENLGFSISLSLYSPSVQEFGEDSVNVLCTIAFFPRGINEDHAACLFPSIRHILRLLDTLRRVSLIYRSGSFLTMLAPVRLFLRDTFQTTGLALLQGIRKTYYDSLEAPIERDFHAGLIVSDHLNIEHLIAYDISRCQRDMLAIGACHRFFDSLADKKPRPTLLAPMVSSFPEESRAEKVEKASCLESLGHLNATLSCYLQAGKRFLAARALFLAVGNHSMVARCTSNAARSHSDRGYFSLARQLLDCFTRSSSWQCIDKEIRAEIYFRLDECRMNMSTTDSDTLFLCSTKHNLYDVASHVLHWRARMLHRHTTPEEVRRNLELCRPHCMSSPNPWDRWYFLGTLAELEFLESKFDAAMQLLSQAHEDIKGVFHLTLVVLGDKAAVASSQGDYNLARSILRSSLNALSMFSGGITAPLSVYSLPLRYFQGRNELYARNYATARQLLVDVVSYCEACDEIGTKALCTRALGEVELLLGQRTESNRYFSQTVRLCTDAGVPPALLGVCKPMMRLDDHSFRGWWTFLEFAGARSPVPIQGSNRFLYTIPPHWTVNTVLEIL